MALLALSLNRIRKTFPTKFVPCFVAFLANIYPLFAAKGASPDANFVWKSNRVFYQCLGLSPTLPSVYLLFSSFMPRPFRDTVLPANIAGTLAVSPPHSCSGHSAVFRILPSFQRRSAYACTVGNAFREKADYTTHTSSGFKQLS